MGKNSEELKIKTLTRLLKRVHLGGLIEECVLNEEKGGVNTIRAIDLTNSIVLSVAGKTNFTGFDKIGIDNLSVICKYLETADDETTMKMIENRLIFKSNSGTFKYLLAQQELIPTNVEDKDIVGKLLESYTHEVVLPEDFQKNFSQNITLTKTNSVSIVIGESVTLSGGLESEHQFTVKIGKPKIIKTPKSNDKFTIPIYGNHLGAVLNVLDWSTRENYPVMYIKEKKPIIIKQNKDVWCLTYVDSKEE